MTLDAQIPGDPAVAVRSSKVTFGLRAAVLAGLVVVTGLGAGDAVDMTGSVAGNVLAGFDTDVTTTTCCMNES